MVTTSSLPDLSLMVTKFTVLIRPQMHMPFETHQAKTTLVKVMITLTSISRTVIAAIKYLLGVILATALVTVYVSAQSTPTDGQTPPGLAPGAPTGAYPLSDFDNVNLYNGHLNFALPLLQIGGRGTARMTITKLIRNTKWRVEVNEVPNGYAAFAGSNWWNTVEPGYGPGIVQGRRGKDSPLFCQPDSEEPSHYELTLTRLTFTMPDGTEYELRDQLTGGEPAQSTCDNSGNTDRGTVFVTADGESATFVSDAPIRDSRTVNHPQFWVFSPSGYLMLRDGTRYRIDNGLVTWLRDHNGNKLSFVYDANKRVISITDSLNRLVTISYGNPDVITYRGFGGATRTIRIGYTNLQFALRPGFSYPINLFPNMCFGVNSYNPSVTSYIELPDGRLYRFYYNNYGELARVELPTGGAYEYDYAAGVVNDFASGQIGQDLCPNNLPPNIVIYRRVTERRVYAVGGALEGKTTYSRPESKVGASYQNLGYVDVDNIAPNGAVLARNRHYFYGNVALRLLLGPSAAEYPFWKEGKEYKTEELDANSTVLRRVEQNWQQRAPINWWFLPPDEAPSNDPRIVETVTTLVDANLVSKQTFGYDQYTNKTDVYEYDFGSGAPGPLIRRTHTPYLTTNENQGNVDYAADVNIHIRDLRVQAIVYDASGNLRSQTDFIYDYYGTFPLVDRPGIVQHDAGFHAGYGARGNLTGVINRNPGGSPSEIHLNNQYDIAGNLVKVVDGQGVPTDFDFSDCFGSPDDEARSNSGAPELAGGFSYAFPTRVTNVLGHTTYTQYDYYLGQSVNSEDANGVISSVAYNDALERPTQGIQARYVMGVGVPGVRRQTIFTYDDANRVITARSDRDTFNDNTLTSKSYYDSLGRTWRSATYEGSTWAITDTQFDALGRVSQVSNPYRAADPGSASPPSGLRRTTNYDALGRVIKVTTPDGAHVDTAYSGAQVTVTDQAGKKRRSETDALGRLIKVTEDPGGLNYETTYLYDALNNLRRVTQGVQTRWFAYDSLSRLIRAKNPEQSVNGGLPAHTDPLTGAAAWAMAYSYDANGNLTQRIDARGVVTNYSYDALNRNTETNYVNGSQTRSVKRFYDGAVNGKGRLHYEETTEGGVNATQTKIESYDALGRPINKQQSFWRGSDWGTPFVIQQSYDLAGTVKTLTYPSGHIVNYSHDQAGRLSGFSGNLSGSTVNYADTISYNAAGQMIKERFGTNTPLYRNLHYNNRLQLVDMRLGDSATDEWNWSRGATGFLYGTTAVNNWDMFASDTDNNGNMRRQINYVPLASGGHVISQMHDYYYDALNRIAAVRERQRNESGQWADSVSQAFSYDQWGNRTLDLSGGGGGGEVVWVDDALPAGASVGSDGGDNWTWARQNPAPYSGAYSHQAGVGVAEGLQTQYFHWASQPLQLGVGDRLYAYVYLDPENPPVEVWMEWHDQNGGFEHRAYWGETDRGSAPPSYKYMGPLPQTGIWARLEVPANLVGLEGQGAYGIAFRVYDGRANWDQAGKASAAGDTVWFDDALPAGAIPASGNWTWVGPSPSPHSGAVSHQSNIASGIHQHYFYGTSQALQVNAGDKLYTYVYLDPANPPSEVMLQWNENGNWDHRAYWGANNITGWGVDGTQSRRHMGPLPPAGQWVRLEVEASAVGLEGKTLNGMAFTLYGGRANWDKAGKVNFAPLAGAGPPINNRVYTVDATTNRLTSVNGVAMSYDDAGNQTNDGSGQRVYDGENRMVEAKNNAGVTVSWYVYDAEGRRVVRTVGSQGTWQIYGCGGELLAEYAVGASPSSAQKEYGYRNGQLLVVWDGSETGDRRLQWLVQDHLGSTRMVVDRSGSLGGVRRHDFAPFGEKLPAGVGIRSASNGYSSDSVRQKFVGYERDSETGLDFVQARYYSDIQGRFTGVDPLNPVLSYTSDRAFSRYIAQPQNWNGYAFNWNNPLKYVDPDGKNPLLGALIGAGIGAGIELAKQVWSMKPGESGTIDWGKVTGEAVKGAVIGAVAGATGGLSLGKYIVASAGGAVAGGIVGRATEVTYNAIDGGDLGKLENLPGYAFDAESVLVDAAAGALGGAAGKGAQSAIGKFAFNRYLGSREFARASQTLRNSGDKSAKQIARATQTVNYNMAAFKSLTGHARDVARDVVTIGITLFFGRHKPVDCNNPNNRCKTDLTILTDDRATKVP